MGTTEGIDYCDFFVPNRRISANMHGFQVECRSSFVLEECSTGLMASLYASSHISARSPRGSEFSTGAPP